MRGKEISLYTDLPICESSLLSINPKAKTLLMKKVESCSNNAKWSIAVPLNYLDTYFTSLEFPGDPQPHVRQAIPRATRIPPAVQRSCSLPTPGSSSLAGPGRLGPSGSRAPGRGRYHWAARNAEESEPPDRTPGVPELRAHGEAGRPSRCGPGSAGSPGKRPDSRLPRRAPSPRAARRRSPGRPRPPREEPPAAVTRQGGNAGARRPCREGGSAGALGSAPAAPGGAPRSRVGVGPRRPTAGAGGRGRARPDLSPRSPGGWDGARRGVHGPRLPPLHGANVTFPGPLAALRTSARKPPSWSEGEKQYPRLSTRLRVCGLCLPVVDSDSAFWFLNARVVSVDRQC